MKTYKPKEVNKKKLEKAYEEVKKVKPQVNYLFSKAKVLIFVVLLSSCSAEWHFQQACKKEPMFCEDEYIYDTIIKKDTLIYEKEFYTKSIDTIVIDTGNVQVKIIRTFDVIKTYIKVNPDTIRITKTLKPKVIKVKDETNFNLYVILLAIVSIILWLLRRR
jgi:hypothetical protein